MTDWNKVAALAQVGATAIAFFAFVYLARQVRGGNRAADLQALNDFVDRVGRHEAELVHAIDERARRRAFFELMNFFEISALSLARGLYGKATAQVAEEKLIDSLAIIWADPALRPLIEEGITGPTVFENIGTFYGERRSRIRALTSTLAGPEGADCNAEKVVRQASEAQ